MQENAPTQHPVIRTTGTSYLLSLEYEALRLLGSMTTSRPSISTTRTQFHINGNGLVREHMYTAMGGGGKNNEVEI